MRVLSWNLWAFDTDRTNRRRAIQQTLVERQPDICCLQEVRDDEREDLGRVLAENLGLRLDRSTPLGVGWWRERLGDESAVVRNVVLSRWPTSDVTTVELPADAGTAEERSALAVRVATPAGPVLVVTTQLASAPWSSSLRSRQVRAIAELVASRRRPDDGLIVTGDLNAEPDSDEVRLLCGHKTPPAAEGFVVMDAWRFAPVADPGWTWDRRNPFVRATGEPSSRIDYVLLGALPTGRLPTVRSATVVGGMVDGRPASDHFAVEVELDLPPPRASRYRMTGRPGPIGAGSEARNAAGEAAPPASR